MNAAKLHFHSLKEQLLPFGYTRTELVGVVGMGWWLDYMTLVVFSNLNSMILQRWLEQESAQNLSLYHKAIWIHWATTGTNTNPFIPNKYFYSNLQFD